MDPDVTLLRLRLAYTEVTKQLDEGGVADPRLVEELARMAEALDTWLVGGGFLPEDWRKEREHTTPTAG